MSAASRLAVRGVAAVRLAALVGCVAASPSLVLAQTEAVEYYVTDALGSIRVVFDANGVELGRADYLPFGEELSSSAGLPPERFTGQARDGEVGLDYLHARMYDASVARLATVDPVFSGLFEPQGWNRYSYARNAPLTFIDPLGLDPCPPGRPPGTFCTSNNPPKDEVKIDTGSGGWFYVYIPRSYNPWYLPAIPTGPHGPTGGGSVGNDGGSGGDDVPAPPGPPPPPPNAPSPTPEPNGDGTGAKPWGKCFGGNFSFARNGTRDWLQDNTFGAVQRAVSFGVSTLLVRDHGFVSGSMAVKDAWNTYRSYSRPLQIYGVANLGVRGTVLGIGGTAMGTAVLGTIVFESGIIVGSGADALGQTLAGYCW